MPRVGHVGDGVDRARRVGIETKPFQSILIRRLGPDVVRIVEAVEPDPVADRAVLRHLRLRSDHGVRDDGAVGDLRALADQGRPNDGRALADAGVGVDDDWSEDSGARCDRMPFADQERRGPAGRPAVAGLVDHVMLGRGEQPVGRGQVGGTALDGDVAAGRPARDQLPAQFDQRFGGRFEVAETARDRDQAGGDGGDERPGRLFVVAMDATHPAAAVDADMFLGARDARLEGHEVVRHHPAALEPRQQGRQGGLVERKAARIDEQEHVRGLERWQQVDQLSIVVQQRRPGARSAHRRPVLRPGAMGGENHRLVGGDRLNPVAQPGHQQLAADRRLQQRSPEASEVRRLEVEENRPDPHDSIPFRRGPLTSVR
jgi:hypothetical protein